MDTKKGKSKYTMSDHWLDRVRRVKHHVRNNLSTNLNLEELAQVAHSSPYHFHRIFKAVCGETIAAFARRARLERAAYLMKATPERDLSSIALEVGYPALSEFSRSFKGHYGLAPNKWNRSSPLNTGPVCEKLDPQNHGWDFEAKIVQHQECRIAYVRMQTWFEVEKLKRGFEILTRWLENKGINWRELEMVGMSWDHYLTTPLEKIRYDLAFPVPLHTSGDHEIGIYTLPTFKAVEVHCHGPLNIVADAWDYLYDDWFAHSSYEPANLPPMKRFRQRPDEIGWNTWNLDCSIALK